MPHQPDQITIALPSWLAEHMLRYEPTSDREARMRFVIDASRRNMANNTGGPFAAAIFEMSSGTLVSLGVNLVTTAGLSVLHAEIVAIMLAQNKLNSYDLGAAGLAGLELFSSTEPCAMCLGAIPWSGIRRVVTGARDGDARSIGFDEGPKPADWKGALEQRGIEVISDVGRAQAAQVLRDYGTAGGRIYNSREQ